ncbi:MAG: mandelate racemase/muconate lactonizing enzyme family protein [Planctomycetota bacterium]
MTAKPDTLEIFRTAIPMRSFEHAAARRAVAEAIVVRLCLTDGRCGWGETLPRHYVTGETLESVVEDLQQAIWPACHDLPLPGDGNDPAAAEFFQRIPTQSENGRCLNAAACAWELAALDCCWAGGFRPSALTDAFGGHSGGGAVEARATGVLGSADPRKTAKRLRLMRWAGLRDFKLKLGLGTDVDTRNLFAASMQLMRGLERGQQTLRVDVNGGWTLDEATDVRVDELTSYGVCAVEQPVTATAEELAALSRRCELPLIADESLCTEADAQALLAEPQRVWWNIRISKCGGLLRSLQLCRSAADAGVPFVVGCMVGESGILSLAQRRLLQLAPAPRLVEGNYGRLLLAADLTRPSPRFGFGGRLSPPGRRSWGRRVRRRAVQRCGELVVRLAR